MQWCLRFSLLPLFEQSGAGLENIKIGEGRSYFLPQWPNALAPPFGRRKRFVSHLKGVFRYSSITVALFY